MAGSFLSKRNNEESNSSEIRNAFNTAFQKQSKFSTALTFGKKQVNKLH